MVVKNKNERWKKIHKVRNSISRRSPFSWMKKTEKKKKKKSPLVQKRKRKKKKEKIKVKRKGPDRGE